MLINYLKTAWRNLIKKRLYLAIHILGLFTGISFALLIGVFVWQQFRVNKDLRNADRQYILTSRWENPNMGNEYATLAPLAETVKNQYPHLVANFYRWDGITSIVSNGTQNFREGIQLGDETLLEMYGFRLLHGEARTAFSQPYSVVLKAEKAIKFFGKTDVIGETLSIQNFNGEFHDFKITGVLAKTSENTVIEFTDKIDLGFIIAKNTARFFNRDNFDSWQFGHYVSYIELLPGVSAADLELPFREIVNKNTTSDIYKNLTIVPVNLNAYFLSRGHGTVIRMLYTLSFIAIFILLMAMINFEDIAISQSGSRLREIGIRKVLGGLRKQLIIQFLIEALTLAAISTLLACAAYPLFRPWFSALIGKELLPISAFPVYFLWIPFVFILLVGLLAGLYPAFVLSSFKSVNALKGKLDTNPRGNALRKALVGFQYITALAVLIAAMIVGRQIDYVFQKDPGYDKSYVVSALVPRDWTADGVAKMKTVRDAFKKIPSVKHVSLSYEIPNGNNGFQTTAYRVGENPDEVLASQAFISDDKFLETYQIPLLAGSFFDESLNDSMGVVINKKAALNYGFESPEEAVGQQIRIVGLEHPYTIAGVIDDFHFESMQTAIKPQLFFSVNAIPNYRYLSFKLEPESIPATLAKIGETWQELLPGTTFEYQFMNDILAGLYAREVRFKKAAQTATALALLIALLGTFGMVAINLGKRAKEVSIRKVLGAKILDISLLFIREFMIILILSAIVVYLLTYWLMGKWLANYAYHIPIGLSPFALAFFMVGGATFILIVIQTYKVSRQNPIKALRKE